ncbi:MAG: TlpA disulfide reductase family protein [Bacteroidetes bacterium]|nr:TlpA disulfide reductase family protein [Bacteroidota bacterium]
MKVLASLSLFILLPVLAFSQEKANPQHMVKVGDPAPDFTLQYPDGTTTTLSRLKGRVVMLQFTASWCSVCRKEMPFIEKEIWQKHGNDPSFFLAGIDYKEDTSKMARFVLATGITYPLLLDPDGSIFEKYAEKNAGVTRNIIIDREGHIAFLTRLFEREEFDRMKLKIEELLSAK